jgi:hypothetical protein
LIQTPRNESRYSRNNRFRWIRQSAKRTGIQVYCVLSPGLECPQRCDNLPQTSQSCGEKATDEASPDHHGQKRLRHPAIATESRKSGLSCGASQFDLNCESRSRRGVDAPSTREFESASTAYSTIRSIVGIRPETLCRFVLEGFLKRPWAFPALRVGQSPIEVSKQAAAHMND